jgi:exosome complex exonuclease DIS3/RRP44
MNRRHRAAQLAGRASVQLHTLIFFGSEAAREEDAYVLDVETAEKTDPSISVMVPRYGIEGRLKLPIESDDPKLVRLPNEHKFVYDTNASIQVFDRVKVKIWVREVQEHQRELVIELVSPSLIQDETPRKRSGDGDNDTSSRKKQRKK